MVDESWPSLEDGKSLVYLAGVVACLLHDDT